MGTTAEAGCYARGAVQGRAITRFGSPPLVGALALVLVGALALAARAAPRGRVVRVERESAATPPRICMIGHGIDSHLCFGQARAGERVRLFSQSAARLRGELVIESVSEATAPRASLCVSGGAQLVKGSFTSPDDDFDSGLGLRGVQLDIKIARVLAGVPAPSGRDDEQIKLALDGDGNGSADLVVTAYTCTPEGAPASGVRGRDARCFDTHMAHRGKLRRVHQDIVRACR